MIKRKHLRDMFILEPSPADEMTESQVDRIVIDALDMNATKFERVRALMQTASQPLRTGGLQISLFNLIAAEDFPLAADIIIETFVDGTLVAYFIQDRIGEIDNPEQLRRAVGVLAATAREDFVPELLEQDNFFALHTLRAVVNGMQRLVDLDYEVDEVRELAKLLARHIREAKGLEYVRPSSLAQLLGSLDALTTTHADARHEVDPETHEAAPQSPQRPSAIRPPLDSTPKREPGS